jgi:multicomponent K+:H+ antiporter subunit D
LLLVVFALKGALIPLGFWLPPAYGSATAPVAALFAIMTKVGVYAILRVHGLIFGPEAAEAASLVTPWLLPAGLATIAVATLGVLASRDLQRLLACLVVISAGTLVSALGLGSETAVSAALYYTLNSTLVGGGLFLLAGLIARERGDAGGRLDQIRSIERPALLGGLFFIGAVGLAGLPPFAGFAAKVYVLQSALAHPAAAWVFGVLLVSGLMVIVALSRAGSALFWRAGTPMPEPVQARPASQLSVLFLLSGTVFLMAMAGPTTAYTQAAAAQLADRGGYVDAVTANRGVSMPASQRSKP